MSSTESRSIGIGALLFFAACSLLAALSHAQVIDVDITPSHVKNSFAPNQTLGAGIDRISKTLIDTEFNKSTVDKVLEAGWGPVSYR